MRVGPDEPLTLDERLAQADSGDVIVVAPGTYEGPLHLRSHIALVSDSLGGAVIVPSRRDSIPGPTVVADAVTDALLYGFLISPDTSAETTRENTTAIRIHHASVTLRQVRVQGSSGPAITVASGPGNKIVLDSLVIMNGDSTGVVIRAGSGSVRLTHNRIENNRLPTSAPAILIVGNLSPVLEGNQIRSGDRDGVLFRPDSIGWRDHYGVWFAHFFENNLVSLDTGQPFRIEWPYPSSPPPPAAPIP